MADLLWDIRLLDIPFTAALRKDPAYTQDPHYGKGIVGGIVDAKNLSKSLAAVPCGQ